MLKRFKNELILFSKQCWSPDIYLTWACGSQVCQFHSIKLCKDASDDISVKMKRRALKGYGLSVSNTSFTDEVLTQICIILCCTHAPFCD